MGNIAFQLMIITILSKITGLVREVYFGAAFGTSAIKDIYVITNSLTAILFSYLFVSMQTTFIPMYNNVLAQGGRKRADRFTANLTNTLVVVSLLIIALTFLFANPLARLVAPGFSPEKLQQTANFLRITIFGIFFSALFAAPISYLNIYDNFVTPATTGILMNAILILFTFLSARHQSLWLLAIGVVVSKGLQYVFFPRALRRAGYHHRLLLRPADPTIRECLRIALPAIFSILVYDLSVVIDKSIASFLVTNGGVASMDYAAKIIDFVQGIVVVSIVTAAYPRLSRLAQEPKDRPAFKRLIKNSITSGALLVIPAVAGIMVYAVPVTRLFYERGAFTPEATQMVSTILFWYAPAILFELFSRIYIRAFYSLKDTKTPLLAGAIQVGVDIVLNVILSYFFGLIGLASSTSIGALAGVFVLFHFLRKRVGNLALRSMGRSLLKISFATLLMVFISRSFFEVAPIASESIRFLGTLLIAFVVYFISIIALRVPEAQALIRRAWRRYHPR